MARYRLSDDIAYWLGIPEIMIVARNETSRWVDIKCTHWSPLGQAMSEAFLFRVHCPEHAKYTIEIQWDNGTEQTMGRAKMNTSDSAILIHALMVPDDVLRITKHVRDTERVHLMHPMLITDIELVVNFIEEAVTEKISKKDVTAAVGANTVSDRKVETAILLTSMIKQLDTIFAKISTGTRIDKSALEFITDTTAIDENMIYLEKELNEIASASHSSHHLYQNWIYAELRYKLRDGMHILYKNQTGQNR